MPGFTGLTDGEVYSVIQYIKTLSERWQTDEPGTPVVVFPDPFPLERRQDAVKRGESLYHGAGKCWPCHPAYLSPSDRDALRREHNSSTVYSAAVYPDGYFVEDGANISDVTSGRRNFRQMLPPDFLSDTFRAGKRGEDIYRSIAAGIGGTRMYPVYDKFSAEDLWALVHYVSHLANIAGTPEAEAIRRQSEFRR